MPAPGRERRPEAVPLDEALASGMHEPRVDGDEQGAQRADAAAGGNDERQVPQPHVEQPEHVRGAGAELVQQPACMQGITGGSHPFLPCWASGSRSYACSCVALQAQQDMHGKLYAQRRRLPMRSPRVPEARAVVVRGRQHVERQHRDAVAGQGPVLDGRAQVRGALLRDEHDARYGRRERDRQP